METIDNNNKIHLFIKLTLERYSCFLQDWRQRQEENRRQYNRPDPHVCNFVSMDTYDNYISHGQDCETRVYNTKKGK